MRRNTHLFVSVSFVETADLVFLLPHIALLLRAHVRAGAHQGAGPGSALLPQHCRTQTQSDYEQIGPGSALLPQHCHTHSQTLNRLDRAAPSFRSTGTHRHSQTLNRPDSALPPQHCRTLLNEEWRPRVKWSELQRRMSRLSSSMGRVLVLDTWSER